MEPFALVCTECGAEVSLVTVDDLLRMTELPEHRCRRSKRKDAA